MPLTMADCCGVLGAFGGKCGSGSSGMSAPGGVVRFLESEPDRAK